MHFVSSRSEGSPLLWGQMQVWSWAGPDKVFAAQWPEELALSQAAKFDCLKNTRPSPGGDAPAPHAPVYGGGTWQELASGVQEVGAVGAETACNSAGWGGVCTCWEGQGRIVLEGSAGLLYVESIFMII